MIYVSKETYLQTVHEYDEKLKDLQLYSPEYDRIRDERDKYTDTHSITGTEMFYEDDIER